MELLSLESFIEYYEDRGYLPSPATYTGKGMLNSKQLNTKYKDYIKKVEAKNNKDNSLSYQEDWEECRSQVYTRDSNRCRLWEVLSDEERDLALKSGYSLYGFTGKITPAHFIARSRDSKLRCEVDNVYTMALMFHTRLDEGCHPLTGEFIGKDKVLKDWWKRVVPLEVYNKYKERY